MRSVHVLGYFLACAALAHSGGGVQFGSPISIGLVHWGVTDFAQPSFSSFGVENLAGFSFTNNGGKTFTQQSHDATIASNLASMSALSDSPRFLHGYGSVTSKPNNQSATATSFTSSIEYEYSLSSDNEKLEIQERQTPIKFQGLPHPARCGHFACILRLQGSAFVRLPSGKMLQSAIVSWGGNPSSVEATSIVVFASADGLEWNFTSIVANASQYLWSEEGPNEHDMTLLPNGDVLAVIRMDGGDGLKTHPYKNYYKATSSDGGLTWTGLTEIKNAGCARPRLILLNPTSPSPGPLLLSGGRMKNVGTNSPLLWVDHSNTGDNFVEYDISFYHNKGIKDPDQRFTADVNTTAGTRESTCYTALIQTGDHTAAVTYDLMLHGNNTGYLMSLQF